MKGNLTLYTQIAFYLSNMMGAHDPVRYMSFSTLISLDDLYWLTRHMPLNVLYICGSITVEEFLFVALVQYTYIYADT